MSNEWLAEMIERFNTRNFPSYAAFRELSKTVVFGKVWRQPPAGLVSNESSDYLYFILSDEKCVGIVYDMQFLGFGGSDLHWLVLEEHRGQGHLHQALQGTILPHMFQDGRDMQFITVKSDDHAAMEYAKRQGFGIVEVRDSESRLCLEWENKMPGPLGTDRILEKKEKDELKQRVRRAKGLLIAVLDEIECAFGDDEKLFLSEQIDDLERTADEITFL